METDYIRRADVIAELNAEGYTKNTRFHKRFLTIPAADVRPVVLCRDCTWFYDGLDMKCCINHKGVVITDENGFCHHAKPKNGGADG